MAGIRVTNVKVSFKINQFGWDDFRRVLHRLRSRENLVRLGGGNFVQVKIPKHRLPAFCRDVPAGKKKRRYLSISCWNNGSVNLTGIASSAQLSECLQEFVDLFTPHWVHFDASLVHRFKIDNVSASGHNPLIVPNFLSVVSQREKLISPRVLKIAFNNQVFPGLVVRLADPSATCILFKNGNYVVVGVRDIAGVETVARNLEDELLSRVDGRRL